MSKTTKTITTVIFVAGLVIIAMTAMIKWSNARDLYLTGVSHCVVDEAEAQGYRGNPYSQEAWQLFAPNCQ